MDHDKGYLLAYQFRLMFDIIEKYLDLNVGRDFALNSESGERHFYMNSILGDYSSRASGQGGSSAH